MTVCGEKVTGVCIAAKCPHFKRCCPTVWDKYGKIKPKTNEEYLRSLNTEQLAEWLLAHMDCIDCPATSWEKCHKSYYACKEVMLEWLKQPHTAK